MSIYYIYRVVNQNNGKSYIGWTKNTTRRWNNHVYTAKSGKVTKYKLHKAMESEGIENFNLEVIYCSKSNTHIVTEMEECFIKMFDSLENGYNSTMGGQGTIGWVPSEETRETWRRQRKNKIFSKEHRENLSIAAKKNPRMRNPETRKKVSETLKRRGIRPTMTKRQREEKRLNQIGKPIHTEQRKRDLSKKFKKDNPMWNPAIKEKARKNKKGKGTGKRNGRAVFAKIFNPDHKLIGEGYLKELCDVNGFPYNTFLKNSRTNSPLVRGEWKKWNIIQIPRQKQPRLA